MTMTIEDAIWTLRYVNPEDPTFSEATNLAINALRVQVLAEENPPLTLEELREMDWEPAWVDGERETEIGRSGWAIIWYSFVEKYVCIWWPGEDCTDIPSLKSYRDTWLAYRRKPEEATHGN